MLARLVSWAAFVMSVIKDDSFLYTIFMLERFQA